MARRVRLIVLVAMMASLAPVAGADHVGSFYVVPVAGSFPGANDTQWRSDLRIQNFNESELTVEMVLIRSGEGMFSNVEALLTPGGSSSVTIPAGGSVLLRDVLSTATVDGLASGAILIGSVDGRPFTVMSRVYNLEPSGRTIGQAVVPVRDFADQAGGVTNNAMSVAYLPGLIVNDDFRSNIGFVAGTSNSGSGLTLEVVLRGEDGSELGRRTFVVPAGALEHLQFSTTAISSAEFGIGAAELRIVSGDGAVVPYASVVDNISADGMFIPGNFPKNTPAAKTGFVNPFREIFDRVLGR